MAKQKKEGMKGFVLYLTEEEHEIISKYLRVCEQAYKHSGSRNLRVMTSFSQIVRLYFPWEMIKEETIEMLEDELSVYKLQFKNLKEKEGGE